MVRIGLPAITLMVVAAGAFLIGLHVTSRGASGGEESPVRSADGTSAEGQSIPVDTTDLSLLEPVELARYYRDAARGDFRRERGDIESAIEGLSEEDIDALCEAFKRTPYGPEIRSFAMTLSRVGTEKALRALGTFYEREDLPDSFTDHGIASNMADTRSPIAEEILLNAYCNLEQKEIRKVILFGLSRFWGSERVAGVLVERVPQIRDRDERLMVFNCLACVGTERGIGLLRDVAMGKYPEMEGLRHDAVRAFRYSPRPASVSALVQIALHADSDERMRLACVGMVGLFAKGGHPKPIEALCELALKMEGRPAVCREILAVLAGLPDEVSREPLGRLAEGLKDQEMKTVAREALSHRKGEG